MTIKPNFEMAPMFAEQIAEVDRTLEFMRRVNEGRGEHLEVARCAGAELAAAVYEFLYDPSGDDSPLERARARFMSMSAAGFTRSSWEASHPDPAGDEPGSVAARAFATAPSLEAPAGAGEQEAPLVHEEDQQEQGQVVGHAQDDESGVDLARMLAGAIRSTLSSLPFQAPEAIGSLVSMKLRGALAEYERQVAASDQKRRDA